MEAEEVIVLGIFLFILMTLPPGLWAMRLFGKSSIFYAVGLGLLFNIMVGLVVSWLFEMNPEYVTLTWVVCFMILVVLGSLCRADKFSINRKETIIMGIVYLVALGLQFQTSLVSPNLIGSDIHLEYHYSNLVLGSGWNPQLTATTINSCLGITILLPVYKLVTGMELVWVYKILCPMIFAVLPVALYKIFRDQFGTKIALLSTAFFVMLPMFTMDMVQLIRQQQSELFFVLIVLLVLDDMSMVKKLILGFFFSIGVVVSHHGFAIGYMGYFAIGTLGVVVIRGIFRSRYRGVDWKPTILMGLMAILTFGIFVGYYSIVAEGQVLKFGKIPFDTLGKTTSQDRLVDTAVVTVPKAVTGVEPPAFLDKFPALDPFWKEPLLQMAIGLDFARASPLGKIWRVIQYLVEVCTLIGFFIFIFKRKVRVEYMSLVVTSFFVVVGMYVLATYSYGMGATRVIFVTLLFMSPLFVIGVSGVGKLIVRREVVIMSFLVLFIPYYAFNSGVVFEATKQQSKGFIDIPYSIFLSSNRVDIATRFDREDVEAVDWLEDYMIKMFDSPIIYGDTHGARLLIQKFGVLINPSLMIGGNLSYGRVQSLEGMTEEDVGYIFLRKWNVENQKITAQGEYASRYSYSFTPLIREKLSQGEIIYDNGARIILVK